MTLSCTSPSLTGCSGGSPEILPGFLTPNPQPSPNPGETLPTAHLQTRHGGARLTARPALRRAGSGEWLSAGGSHQSETSCALLPEPVLPEPVRQGGGGGGPPDGVKLGPSPGRSGAQPCRPVWARLELCSVLRRAGSASRQRTAAGLVQTHDQVTVTGNSLGTAPALRELAVWQTVGEADA